MAYKRRGQRELGRGQANAVLEVPANSNPTEWEPYVMLAYGIKLGGSRAVVNSGLPIFKGQNIFPSGVLGSPIGYWDSERSIVDSLRLYAYRHLFDYSKLYAIRNVSQLPSACPAPAQIVFQNTAQLIQLSEDFPLNVYFMSRIPQWFAVKVLRASIVEDLFTTWVKRNLLLIPIPANRTVEDIAVLKTAGDKLVQSDRDLANSNRHVEQLIAASPKRSLFELFAENSFRVVGANLAGATLGAVVTSIREQGNEVVSDDLSFRITVPDSALRRYLTYVLRELIDGEEDVTFDRDILGNLKIPDHLESVVEAVDQMERMDPAQTFQQALRELNWVVARLFGMSEADLAHITNAMETDGFLKQLRPSFEHRGLRTQPYSDHSQGDRYA